MRYEDWEQFYLKIVNEFGYSVAEDRLAAEILAGLAAGMDVPKDAESFMGEKVRGKSFMILGPCPMEVSAMSERVGSFISSGGLLATVGEGTKNAYDTGMVPALIFTDLDGFPEADIAANEKGATVVVHAHGDNIARLKTWVPKFTGKIIPTCQCAPLPGIHNWGGFTDGDRAFCALRHFGAAKIELEAFDFRQPCGSKHVDVETKKRKLEWAERIIENQRA
jgi:uncharacterized Rossmann fold enzyme